jgi:hypothetical protein
MPGGWEGTCAAVRGLRMPARGSIARWWWWWWSGTRAVAPSKVPGGKVLLFFGADCKPSHVIHAPHSWRHSSPIHTGVAPVLPTCWCRYRCVLLGSYGIRSLMHTLILTHSLTHFRVGCDVAPLCFEGGCCSCCVQPPQCFCCSLLVQQPPPSQRLLKQGGGSRE